MDSESDIEVADGFVRSDNPSRTDRRFQACNSGIAGSDRFICSSPELELEVVPVERGHGTTINAKARFRIPISMLKIRHSRECDSSRGLDSCTAWTLFRNSLRIRSTKTPFVPEDWIPVARAMRCNCADFSDGNQGMNSDADADADPKGCFKAAAADPERDAAKSVAERRILYTGSLLGIEICDRNVSDGAIFILIHWSVFPDSIN